MRTGRRHEQGSCRPPAGDDYGPDRLEVRLADLGGARHCLFEDYMLLMQACEHEDPRADMAVKGSHDALDGAL